MANATFSKNHKTGDWDVKGPASFVVAGDYCSVSRADGTVRRIFVSAVSRAFMVNGVPYVFGTIGAAPKAAPKARKAAPAPTPAFETNTVMTCNPDGIVREYEEVVDPNEMDF